MLGKRTTVIFAVLAVSLALVNGEVTKEGDKITIRTKRQQCVCIVVSPGSNQLQCNCDNAQPAITPQGQQQQQQELQQQLQQVQSPQTVSGATGSTQTTCGCVLIVIKIQGAPETTGSALQSTSAQSPQYQCQCSTTPQQPTSNTVPQQYNPLPTQSPITSTTARPQTYSTAYPAVYQTTRQPYPATPTYIPQQYNISESSNNPCTCVQILVSNGASQYHCDCNGLQADTATSATTGSPNFLQDQTGNRNFLSSALNQADYLGNNINNYQQTQYTQQPQQSLVNAYTQSPVTTYQNTLAPSGLQTPVVPQNYLNSALNQANYLNTAAGMVPQQTQGLYNTQQLSTSQLSNYQQDSSVSQYDAEPATTTCITISVPGSCMCGNNYVQCADNMCCHKRYRSQKSEESAMDIIVDVLKNIKDRLDRS